MKCPAWHGVFVLAYLALLAAPCWAQSEVVNFDLKEATLGQIVDSLQTQGAGPTNILITEKLRSLKIGAIKLTNVRRADALEAISVLSGRSFTVETVNVGGGEGGVVVLRPRAVELIVKAVKLQWIEDTRKGYANLGDISDRERQRIEGAEESRLAEHSRTMLAAIEEAFLTYENITGRAVGRPEFKVQDRLSLIVIVGPPESVKMAEEIVNASNSLTAPSHHSGQRDFGGGGGGFF